MDGAKLGVTRNIPRSAGISLRAAVIAAAASAIVPYQPLPWPRSQRQATMLRVPAIGTLDARRTARTAATNRRPNRLDSRELADLASGHRHDPSIWPATSKRSLQQGTIDRATPGRARQSRDHATCIGIPGRHAAEPIRQHHDAPAPIGHAAASASSALKMLLRRRIGTEHLARHPVDQKRSGAMHCS